MRLIIIAVILFTQCGFAANSPAKKDSSLPIGLSLGELTFQTSSKNEQANAHFLLGFKFLYTFNYEKAIKQFRYAQTLDRQFTMAYLGEAMSYMRSLQQQESLVKARAVMDRVSNTNIIANKKEQYYLKAISELLSDKDKTTRQQTYLSILKEMLQKYPNDLNIQSAYLLALMISTEDENLDKTVKRKHTETARELATHLVKLSPKHPGILNNALHLYDADTVEMANKALPVARSSVIYVKDSPQILSKSADVFRRLKKWPEFINASKLTINAVSRLCQWKNENQRTTQSTCGNEQTFRAMEWVHYGYLQTNHIKKAETVLKSLLIKINANTQLSMRFKPFYYRMWARQVIATRGKKHKIENIKLSRPFGGQYWRDYSACGAWLANGFIALSHDSQTQLNRAVSELDALIKSSRRLNDQSIVNTCRLHRAELMSLAELKNGNKNLADHYLQLAKIIARQTTSNKYSPSPGFLPISRFKAEFYDPNRRRKQIVF